MNVDEGVFQYSVHAQNCEGPERSATIWCCGCFGIMTRGVRRAQRLSRTRVSATSGRIR